MEPHPLKAGFLLLNVKRLSTACLEVVGPARLVTDTFYSEKVQPVLAAMSASVIARQISVSRWYAGRIREGYRPHPRHWKALAELIGVAG